MVADPLVAVAGDLFAQLLLSRTIQSLPRLGQLLPSKFDAFDGPVKDELVVGSNTVCKRKCHLRLLSQIRDHIYRDGLKSGP